MSFNEFISVVEDKKRKSPRRKLFDDTTILSSSHAHSESGKSKLQQNPRQYDAFAPGYRSSSMMGSLLENMNQSFPQGVARKWSIPERKRSSNKSVDFQTPVANRGPTKFTRGRSPSAGSGHDRHSPLANSTFSSISSGHFSDNSVKSADFANSTFRGNVSARLDESDASSADFRSPTKPEESLLEWFDKSMEEELKKRRSKGADKSPHLHLPNRSGLSHPLIVDAAANTLEIQAGLRSDFDTDLMEAADRFAKAEAVVAFEGAVRAAEEAAAKVSPELAEDAAVEGARGFQAELTSCVNQKIPGIKPVEVIGYIGITRPKTIRRPS